VSRRSQACGVGVEAMRVGGVEERGSVDFAARGGTKMKREAGAWGDL